MTEHTHTEERRIVQAPQPALVPSRPEEANQQTLGLTCVWASVGRSSTVEL